MPQFFMNKRLIILLVSIIILVALIGFSLSDRNKLTWPEQFVKDTTGWVQTLVSRPAHFVVGFVDNVKSLQDTYKENKELKAKLEENAQLKYQVQGLKKDVQALQDTLEEKESLSDYTLMKATVIRRNPSQWTELVTINRGDNDGVEKNMAVITSAGLIGKIKSVAPNTATVQLLSSEDPANRISAFIQPKEDEKKNKSKTEVFGIIADYDKETKQLIMTWEEVPNGLKVEKGQLVTTSGMGGVFPKGLAIGTVEKVEPDENGLQKKVFIKPAADFYDIEHVMVVDRAALSPEEEEQ
ncbi:MULTISPECIES: rod shape-determining protein MreC [Niallia]|jgi:rod shape-determining protein MreC|uniref:Cell shape-determining protein MreC n=1 Tax=Niallia circulans TaxID=1397 RepID=A0A941GF22_NIACI|nr:MULTISPECIES: rod shape-determining protein MreC [Niallia]MBQ6446973.1 rod shape-determining protein MreC [Bacillus sp. (in: firmicutes)]MDU1844150.1 rod shape-determining protein MreC [Niallia nealsonii]MCB5235640.1 rod shape-determining protein MreC [Niallia circulans]MED3791681.1 rod shape-determining protein MreC [Niallia alba]UTI41897.1 rod shape-determining protein MreC [Niallia sp. RD1]